MLSYAKTLVGKPFSNAGMARSILFPRQTTGDSFFCAGMYSLRHSMLAHFPKTPTMWVRHLPQATYTLRSPVRRTRRGRAQEGRTHVRCNPHARSMSMHTHPILCVFCFAGRANPIPEPRPPRASTACTRTNPPLRPTRTHCVSLQNMERPQGIPGRRAFDSWVLDPSTPLGTRAGTRPPLPPPAGVRRAREATLLFAQASAASAEMGTPVAIRAMPLSFLSVRHQNHGKESGHVCV